MSFSKLLTSTEAQALSIIGAGTQPFVSASISLAKGDYLHARSLCISALKRLSKISSQGPVCQSTVDALDDVDSVRKVLKQYVRLDVDELSGEVSDNAVSKLAGAFDLLEAAVLEQVYLFEYLLVQSLDLEMQAVLFELESMFLDGDYDNCIKRCERNSLLINSFYQAHSAGFLGSKVDSWYQDVMQQLAKLCDAAKFVSASGGLEGIKANLELLANKPYEHISKLMAQKNWVEAVDCAEQEIARIRYQGMKNSNKFTHTLLATITQPLLYRLESAITKAQAKLIVLKPTSNQKVAPVRGGVGSEHKLGSDRRHKANSQFVPGLTAALFGKLNIKIKNNKVAVISEYSDYDDYHPAVKNSKDRSLSPDTAISSGATSPATVGSPFSIK